MHIVTSVTEGENLFSSFIDCFDLGLACGATTALLARCLPGDGATASHDEEVTEGAELEHFHLLTISDQVAELATEIGVTVPSEQVHLVIWRRRSVVIQ